MISRLSVVALLLVVVAGCLPKPVDIPHPVWPAPPDPPRIEYQNRIEGSRTYQMETKGFLAREALGLPVKTIPLEKPFDVQAGPNGRLFITDTAAPGVVMLDPAQKVYERWATSGPGGIVKGAGMDLDSQGRLYVADTILKRVVVLDAEGELVTTIGSDTVFTRPAGVAVDSKRGRIYVTDSKAHDIKVFDTEGVLLRRIGAPGNRPGFFNTPTLLAVAPDGTVVVSDSMNFRVQRLSPEGDALGSFGSIGTGPGYFNRLKGIDVDSEGRVWTVDAASGRIQLFDEDGNLLMFVSEFGPDYGQLYLPAGLDISDDGSLYVVSQMNKAIEQFHLLSDEEIAERFGVDALRDYEERLRRDLEILEEERRADEPPPTEGTAPSPDAPGGSDVP